MNMNPWYKNQKVLDSTVPICRMQAGEDFAVWQARARERLASLLGMDHFTRVDPQTEVCGMQDHGTYTTVRLNFRSEADYALPCVLALPKNISRKIPLVVCLQGHSTGMHISLGEQKFPGDEKMITGGDRDFARQLVDRGMAALAVEQRNFGECGGKPTGPDCFSSSMTALLTGRTTVGERVWDVSRALDVVFAEFGDILDENRIACMGNSGGGTTTCYAAALDTRIAVAMPSCAVSTFRASIAAVHHCACNYVPHIAEHFDMGDLLGMIAPRGLVVVSGVKDNIFPIDGARDMAELARSYYRAAGSSDRIRMVEGPEGHSFYAALSYPVFSELLGVRQ